jgi:flagellar biosynthesis anti-sigma factor FlgM
MNSIDRLSAQDAARTYTQNIDVTRSGDTQQASKLALRRQRQQAASVDSVTLSDNARSLASARDAVQNAPDVRQGKVDGIKAQISDGTYNVPASVLARNILGTVDAQR